jgi:hypothetical protein
MLVTRNALFDAMLIMTVVPVVFTVVLCGIGAAVERLTK